MKMYILVRDDIPLGAAMVAVAHASLAGYLKFQNEPEVQEWLRGPFFKVVCMVNAKEFSNAKKVVDHLVLTESALGNEEVAVVFKPRHEWPKMFRFLRLYRSQPVVPGASPPTAEQVNGTLAGGESRSTVKSTSPCAPGSSYRLQTLEALARTDGEGRSQILERERRGELISVMSLEARGERLYPSFQVDPRVDVLLLRDIVDLYRKADLDLGSLWDFLRSVQKPLGGMTGVDFLMGYYAAEQSDASPQELRQHFLELAEEDISRANW